MLPLKRLKQRTPARWLGDAAIVAAALTLSYCSVTFSLAQILAKTDLAKAHALAPYDGRIAARYAASLATPEADAAQRLRSDVAAKQALAKDVTAVLAVSTLAMNAQIRGETPLARRLFGYSERLSRRDLQTQLWAIQDSVQRGNVSEALRHYDIALNVYPRLSTTLFPILADASSDMSIRTELVRTLARKPRWGTSFINFVSGAGPDPKSVSQMLIALRTANVFVSEFARASVIHRLVDTGNADAAWSYYLTWSPKADRHRSRDPKLMAGLQMPSLFDWLPINTGEIVASIQNGGFNFSAPPSVGGLMLQQVQLFSPGTYVLTGHSSGIEQPERSRPFWMLQCQGGRILGRVALPNSTQNAGNFAGTFTVPADCPVQTLALVARPSEAIAGLSGQIDRIELSPAS